MRKTLILAVGLAFLAGPALAQYNSPSSYGSSGLYGTGSNPSSHQTRGYTTQSGTVVQPHYQTNPNSTQMDNYGTRGNFNPHTGAYGTRSPYR